MSEKIPYESKILVSIQEASRYSGIGEKKLREMAREKNCNFVRYVGQKAMVKRRVFEQFLESQQTV